MNSNQKSLEWAQTKKQKMCLLQKCFKLQKRNVVERRFRVWVTKLLKLTEAGKSSCPLFCGSKASVVGWTVWKGKLFFLNLDWLLCLFVNNSSWILLKMGYKLEVPEKLPIKSTSFEWKTWCEIKWHFSGFIDERLRHWNVRKIWRLNFMTCYKLGAQMFSLFFKLAQCVTCRLDIFIALKNL